jgi:hypothetical protein
LFFSKNQWQEHAGYVLVEKKFYKKNNKKTKQNLTKEATSRTTAARNTKPTNLRSSSHQTALCTPQGTSDVNWKRDMVSTAMPPRRRTTSEYAIKAK